MKKLEITLTDPLHSQRGDVVIAELPFIQDFTQSKNFHAKTQSRKGIAKKKLCGFA